MVFEIRAKRKAKEYHVAVDFLSNVVEEFVEYPISKDVVDNPYLLHSYQFLKLQHYIHTFSIGEKRIIVR
jgi:hypothetical protein